MVGPAVSGRLLNVMDCVLHCFAVFCNALQGVWHAACCLGEADVAQPMPVGHSRALRAALLGRRAGVARSRPMQDPGPGVRSRSQFRGRGCDAVGPTGRSGEGQVAICGDRGRAKPWMEGCMGMIAGRAAYRRVARRPFVFSTSSFRRTSCGHDHCPCLADFSAIVLVFLASLAPAGVAHCSWHDITGVASRLCKPRRRLQHPPCKPQKGMQLRRV